MKKIKLLYIKSKGEKFDSKPDQWHVGFCAGFIECKKEDIDKVKEVWKKWKKEHKEIHPNYKKGDFCECYGIDSIEKFKNRIISKIKI